MTPAATPEALAEALTKINDIRNSIIGLQTMNWSEHIYPLVAALNAAGFEGMSYPEARENYGTMLERTNAAEAALATATAEAASLRAEVEALKAARDPRVDTQVWTAAASLEEAQRHQPAWLWFSDGYGPTFGRWAGGPGQAPYVRADIALARAATAGEGA